MISTKSCQDEYSNDSLVLNNVGDGGCGGGCGGERFSDDDDDDSDGGVGGGGSASTTCAFSSLVSMVTAVWRELLLEDCVGPGLKREGERVCTLQHENSK
jgi:hypothetical protein